MSAHGGSAAGLMWTTTTSGYDAAPALLGAKLNRAGDDADDEGGCPGDGPVRIPADDEFALYGDTDFRSWVLTTGGFSPDGVT